MRIVFAHPERDYDSYVDYRRLVDLSGFESVKVGQADPGAADTVYVVSPVNRHLPEWPPRGRRAAKFVYWNLERDDVPTVPVRDLPGFGVHASVGSVEHLFDAVWVSDRHLASLDRRHTHVVMGGHPGLSPGPAGAAVYDFCHMSYVHGRRRVIGSLAREFRVGPNGFPPGRDAVLRSSRAMLNVHQTESAVGEPLRFALAAACGLPLLSERLEDPWPLREGEDFLSFRIGEAAEKLRVWLREWPPERLAMVGVSLRARLTVEMPFGKCVEEAAGRIP